MKSRQGQNYFKKRRMRTMTTMPIKATKKNNYGRGFWFTFKDGYQCWALGLSATELRNEKRTHGDLVNKKPA